jgi:gamma-glutamyl hercynylcysteine S-oxide synthase
MTRWRSRNIAAHRAAVRQLPLFALRVPGVTMHTTGLTDETIGRLYEGDALATALRDARRRTLALYGHLDLASMRVPQIPIVNPPLWELSHIAWFQERWCLRYSARTLSLDRPPLLDGADALFDSGAVPHASRWTLPMPPLDELLDYMRRTLDATLSALEHAPPQARYFFGLSLLHEDMHGEALLMTLQTLGLPPPRHDALEPPPSAPRPARDVVFAGGHFEQGTAPGTPAFVFDNEKWAHRTRVDGFAIADRPVSEGEFAQFVADGGYANAALWSAEGAQWLLRQAARAPRYWRLEQGQWRARRFDRWEPIAPHAPMVHVGLHEAEAYCRWAGRRLPSESEWEYAARNAGAHDRYPWGDEPRRLATLDLRHRGPFSPPDDEATSRLGLRQMIGGVWEWTSSRFRPYPGFRADPYQDYSQPWFESHAVLRGGCFATRGRLVHNRFRNFYLPERGDAFAGFRTCALE